MRKIRDVEDYYDEDFDDEQKTRSRHFKKEKETREQEKRKWDREDHYRRPYEYDDQ